MTTKQAFDCPWSGTTVQVSIPPKLTSDEFCPKCDFPMFWTYEVRDATEQYEKARIRLEAQRAAKERLDARKHRHPDAPAEQRMATVSVDYNESDLVRCPDCSRLNPPGAAYCSSCGSSTSARNAPSYDRWLLALAMTVLVVALALLVLL